MMKTRKHHLKSRNGCLNCKKRHVKCDEQGPPCVNCVSRRTTATCRYEGTSRSNSSSRTTPQESSDSSTSDSDTIQKKPPLLGAPAEIDTLIQLELMHRWSTSTYKGFVAVPADCDFMQVSIPQGGLKYKFLLDGILAVSALEMSLSGHAQADKYRRIAMKLYDQASGTFREQLTKVNSDNFEWVFIYSGMVSQFNAAMLPISRRSAIDTTMTMFELYIGCAVLAVVHQDMLDTCSYAASVWESRRSWAMPVVPKLDDETEEVFRSLQALADARAAHPEVLREPPRLFPSWTVFYHEAIPALRRCYLEDEKKTIAGICLAYPALMGPDVMTACRQRDPMGLLVLLVWAVLIDRLAHLAWWVGDLGSKVILETTEILLADDTDLAVLPEFLAVIYWANSRVGQQKLKTFPWVTEFMGKGSPQMNSTVQALAEIDDATALNSSYVLESEGEMRTWKCLEIAM